MRYLEKDGQIVLLGQLSIKVPGRTIIREYPDGMKETIHIEKIEIVKEQYGGSEVKKYANDGKNYKKGDVMDLANDYKAAATDSLKKCSVELGMFLDVYSSRAGKEEGPSTSQLEALYMRREKAGMDKEQTKAWVVEKIGSNPEDSDPLDIMGLIPKLIEMEKKAGIR